MLFCKSVDWEKKQVLSCFTPYLFSEFFYKKDFDILGILGKLGCVVTISVCTFLYKKNNNKKHQIYLMFFFKEKMDSINILNVKLYNII